MSEEIKIPRLGKAAREFNVATSTIVEFLSKKGFTIEDSINAKLTADIYSLLTIEYQSEKNIKEEAQRLVVTSLKPTSTEVKTGKEKLVKSTQETKKRTEAIEKEKIATKNIVEKVEKKETPSIEPTPVEIEKESETDKANETEKKPPIAKPKIIGKVDLDALPKNKKRKKQKESEAKTQKEEITQAEIPSLPAAVMEDNLPQTTSPMEKQLVEKQPEETKTAGIQPEENKPEENKSEENKQEENKSEENKPEENKSEENKPEENKPEENKSEEDKPDTLPEVDLSEKKKMPELLKMNVPSLKTPTVVGKLDLGALHFEKYGRKAKEEQREKRLREERALRNAKRIEQEEARKAEYRRKREQESQQGKPAEPSKPTEQPKQERRKPDNFIRTNVEKLSGVKVVDKIDLPVKREHPKGEKEIGKDKDKNRKWVKVRDKNKTNNDTTKDTTKDKDAKEKDKGTDANRIKRKRITTTVSHVDKKPDRPFQKDFVKRKDFRKDKRTEISNEEIDLQIRRTMARMAPTGKTKASKHRREKRDQIHHEIEQAHERKHQEKHILKVTEFITVNDLANMMNIAVNQLIATCMGIGLVVAINQRLDAENIALLAGEYGYSIQFVGVDSEEDKQEDTSNPEDMRPRAPIVTVMGHVDHGKTSLLDYIRKTNVIAGEAGGITQHIGAYEVELADKRRITFLDTPGHEAFTAMRARGAKVTDIVIVVIAADDAIMPQTIEAINHAQAAGVPMIFAINKIDKAGADPEKIRNALATMNLLVEEWGGKIQSQNISAKKGINVEILLEKILIEAEMLELKANPKALATGTVIESSLDKGRGYVAKMLIQNGTLRKGDIVVAGTSHGKIRAMYNERNQIILAAEPSSPILLLGLDSAPQAGDTFKVYTDERESKTIVSKRQQLIREQGLRTQKHITLTEIGRRIAVGDFKELNIIVKGDVDGSIEALSDSLLRLTTEEVEVKVIHKSVGPVTESDVLLASASNAIIIAFQVRPSAGARKLAEHEQIDIRIYSIIYDVINEIKDAIEGMKAPVMKESIVCNIEVREIFRISKVGTIAGCYVLDGKIQRGTRIRIIRDGIVIFTGRLGSLKRFKDDVKEVTANYECGLNIESFNDIQIGDIVEGFEEVEVKR
jgi:translation initiation factor IF-2